MAVQLARAARSRLLASAAATLAGCGTVMNTMRDGADDGLMVGGNDPVSYFAGEPLEGDPTIKSTYRGVTYRFANAQNKAAFDANPDRYAPAYGGFCASGAPYALKAKIGFDPWKVIDDRLYFFGSPRSQRYWEMDLRQNIRIGDRYWATETKDVPFRWQSFERYTFKVPGYKTDAELDAEYLQRFGKLPPGAPAPQN